MNILLRDFNTKLKRDYIFKPTGNAPISFCSWDSTTQQDGAMGHITRNWGGISGRSNSFLLSIAATPASVRPTPKVMNVWDHTSICDN
jgi:hypothetical protein